MCYRRGLGFMKLFQKMFPGKVWDPCKEHPGGVGLWGGGGGYIVYRFRVWHFQV